MTNDSQIVYVPRPDTTPEVEAEALAAVYRFILFDCRRGNAVGAISNTEEPEEERSAR